MPLSALIKVTGYTKKTRIQYIFALPERDYQDYANDVRIIILTSLNLAQIGKKWPKNAEVTIPGIGSGSAKKEIGST